MMSRVQVLKKLGYETPMKRQKRVIIHSDIANEADDVYAIMHHLLTPSEHVLGIIAAHHEYAASVLPEVARQQGMTLDEFLEVMKQQGAADTITPRGESMQFNYEAGKKLLQLADMEEIPLYQGSRYELQSKEDLPDSPGADFMIEEAMKEDDRPLYIVLQGSITDLAIAYKKQPEIAKHLTAIWIGGGAYPDGAGGDFNMRQDVIAARIVMESDIPFWQIPSNVYASVETSLAELNCRVRPCGKLGEYLVDQLQELNILRGNTFPGEWPHGESWCLGDNPCVSVLLEGGARKDYHMEDAPIIGDDLSYVGRIQDRKIRVYDSVDVRLTLEDFFSKMQLCYGL